MDGHWWIPSGRWVFATDAQQPFYLPSSARDPFGLETDLLLGGETSRCRFQRCSLTCLVFRRSGQGRAPSRCRRAPHSCAPTLRSRPGKAARARWPPRSCSPTGTEQTARRRLNTALWRLRTEVRSCTGVEIVADSSARTVALSKTAEMTTDTARFHDLADPVLRGRPEDMTDGHAAQLEAAVVLHRGRLLEVCDDEWVLAERYRIENRYLTSLDYLLQYYGARGDVTNVTKYGELALDLEPLPRGHPPAPDHRVRRGGSRRPRRAPVRALPAAAPRAARRRSDARDPRGVRSLPPRRDRDEQPTSTP